MPKPQGKDLKIGRGVSLSERRWEEVDAFANARGLYASEVIDAALDLYFSSLAITRNTGARVRKSEDTFEVA